MPTLRLTLFDRNFEVLDRADIAVPGEERPGANQAVKAAKQHLWENHFSADLDPLLASRQNLLERLDDLIIEVEKLKSWEAQTDLLAHVARLSLTEARSAVMESKMINDASLPEKYKKELEARYGRKVDQMGRKI